MSLSEKFLEKFGVKEGYKGGLLSEDAVYYYIINSEECRWKNFLNGKEVYVLTWRNFRRIRHPFSRDFIFNDTCFDYYTIKDAYDFLGSKTVKVTMVDKWVPCCIEDSKNEKILVAPLLNEDEFCRHGIKEVSEK